MEPTPRHFAEYLGLYKATLHGDWPAAERIFNSDPLAMTAQITDQFAVPVHIAAGTHRNMQFLKELVRRMTETQLEILNSDGMAAIHVASIAGNTEAARILLSKHPKLLLLRTSDSYTPLQCAALQGHEETVRFLLPQAENLDRTEFQGDDGVRLVKSFLEADLFDIAHYVLEKYPNLYLQRDPIGSVVLFKLARRPQAFPSGISIEGGSVEMSGRRSTKLMHKHAIEIVRRLCEETTKLTAFIPDRFFSHSLFLAAESGIYEIVTMIIKAYPYTFRLHDLNNHSVIHLAILHHQEKVFNLLYQMSEQKNLVIQSRDFSGNTILHLAGKLAPSKRISGAALQMQRELQWFEEVEKIVPPSFKELMNIEQRTPRMVFTEEHRELVKKGEEWMKGTASSCTVVAALVATVVFASVFTVPGGNDSDKGIPIFLNDFSFMVFALSDAVALFSSSTSVLMFLAILTSRYEEEDFLKSLPMKLSIGLISLFISITSLVIAFSASFYIVLSHRSEFVLIPIVLLAAFPAILFAWLQFPLLVEIVLSTFGPSIFGQQGKEIIF